MPKNDSVFERLRASRGFVAAEFVFALLGFATATIAIYEFLIADRSLPSYQAELSVCAFSSGLAEREREEFAAQLEEFGLEARGLGVFLNSHRGRVVYLDLQVGADCVGDPAAFGAEQIPELYGPERDITSVAMYLEMEAAEPQEQSVSNLTWEPFLYVAVVGQNDLGRDLLSFRSVSNPPADHLVEVRRSGESVLEVAPQYRGLRSEYALLIRHSADERITLADRRLSDHYGNLRFVGAYRVRGEDFYDAAELTVFPMDYDSELDRKVQCSKALLAASTPGYDEEGEPTAPGWFSRPIAYLRHCVLPQ